MRSLTSTLVLPVLILLAALVAVGCGSDDESGGDASGSDAGALSHVDGLVALDGEQLVVTPADGEGEDLTFELGPEVQVGELRAIEASGAPARVSYRSGTEPLVAASVQPAPALGEGVQSYEGTVVSTDGESLVVDGDGGERTFDVSGADPGVFDVAHLEEHAENGEPIKVYFDPEAPDVGIAYEDA